jgi:hypothetical protein
MNGLRAENHAKTTSVDGPSSIMIARGILFWTGNRRADWKVVSRFVNMGRLLPLGAYPSGTHMGNTGLQTLSAVLDDRPHSQMQKACWIFACAGILV